MVQKRDPNAGMAPDWYEDVETETDDQLIQKRSEEILKNVWKELDTRMYTKSTSKRVFFEQNKGMAFELAKKELEEEKSSKLESVVSD